MHPTYVLTYGLVLSSRGLECAVRNCLVEALSEDFHVNKASEDDQSQAVKAFVVS